jgi:peptidoglycan/xylan/chitin deacetylase (PgdA/CDA1 family)
MRKKPRIHTLMFHGICRNIPKYALWRGGRICLIDHKDFENLILKINKKYQVLALDNISDYLSLKSVEKDGILITFDDGLASAIEHAVPILQSIGSKAIMFVNVNWIENKKLPEIFKLEKVLFNENVKSIIINYENLNISISNIEHSRIAYVIDDIWRKLIKNKIPPLELLENNIMVNNKTLDMYNMDCDDCFWMPAKWNDIKSAYNCGAIDIGSHMMRHVPLNWLNEKDLVTQLKKSKEILSNLIGKAVVACSYPHGMFDKRTSRIAAEIYRWCFTSTPGYIASNYNQGSLPRYNVDGEYPDRTLNDIRYGSWLTSLRRLYKLPQLLVK